MMMMMIIMNIIIVIGDIHHYRSFNQDINRLSLIPSQLWSPTKYG